MRRKSILIVAVAAFVIALAVSSMIFYNLYQEPEFKLSDSEKAKVMTTVTTFGECAGYFEAMSWYTASHDLPQASTQFHNAYNGWMMSGAFLMHMMGLAESYTKASAYSESLAESSGQHYKAKLELEGDKAFEEMDVFFDTSCAPYKEYQSTLVTQMRELIAGAAETK